MEEKCEWSRKLNAAILIAEQPLSSNLRSPNPHLPTGVKHSTILITLALLILAGVVNPAAAQDETNPYLTAIRSENRRLRDENFKLRQKIANEELEKRIAKKTTDTQAKTTDDEEIVADRSQEADRDANKLYAEHFAASQGVGSVPVIAEEESKKAKWSGQLALDGNATGGNVDGYRVNTDARLIRKNDGHRTTLTANGDYAETETTTTAQQFNTNTEDRHDLSKKSFGKTDIGYLHNDLLGINHQTRASIGIGYYLAKTEKTEWSIDAGPAYVFENRAMLGSSHNANARFGHEIKHSLSDNLRLFQNGEVLTALTDIDKWRYNTEAGIETDISNHMSLRLSGRNRFESQVAEDRENNDFSVGASLVFKLD